MRLHPRRARAQRGARPSRSARSPSTPSPSATRCSCATPTRRTASVRRRRRSRRRAAAQPLPRLRRARAGARGDARRRRLGRLGLRGRAPARSPSCASGSGSSSSARAPPSCAGSATRSRPSGWPRRPACRWRRGAAARSRPSSRRFAHAESIGFPLMVKAAAGRRRARHPRAVDAAEDLPAAFESARAEALRRVRRRHGAARAARHARPATSRCR